MATRKQQAEFAELYQQAHMAGMKAGLEHTPTPMVVYEADIEGNRLGPDHAPVMDGVCGFAWIEVRPTRSTFGNWLRDSERGRYDDYRRCVTIWVGQFNQSMERKEKYAEAFTEVLRNGGIRASAYSRMD